MKIFIFCVFAILACTAYSQEPSQQTDRGTTRCNLECNTARFSGGYFTGKYLENECRCSPTNQTEENLEVLPENSFLVNADATSQRGVCIDAICKGRCKKKGRLGGKCFWNTCKCTT